MKIAYLNAYSDGTGYANYALETMLSLDKAGVTVVPRKFKLATQSVAIPERIKELEKNSIDDIDIIIQHTLPCYFSYRAGPRNLGFFHMETSHWKPSGWQYYMNLMDGLLVSCPENKTAAIESNVTKPISVIPRGLDVNLYDRSKYTPIVPNIGKRFSFYHIGDYSTRKNTINLIKCYFEEFSKSDSVVLVLKTYVEGHNPQQSLKLIQEDIARLKQAMRKSIVDTYPPIILVTDYLSNEQMLALHAQCDCFITLEVGSGYNLPTHDAAAMGNWVIANGHGAHTQFIVDNKHGWLSKFYPDSMSGMTRTPFPHIYTCHENIGMPVNSDVRKLMRIAYDQKAKPTTETTKKFLEDFSYENVGWKIRKALE